MVNTIYLLSFVETSRKFIIAIINLRGVSTKLNKYKVKIVFCLLILHVYTDNFINNCNYKLLFRICLVYKVAPYIYLKFPVFYATLAFGHTYNEYT